MKLVKLLTDKPEFPQGYRFKWIAFNRDNPSERVLFDNHTGKGPHWHENGHQEFLTWVSRQHTQQCFTRKSLKSLVNFNKN